MNAPERIHIKPTHPHKDDLDWYVWSDGTPYILDTPEALAKSPHVEALVKAGRVEAYQGGWDDGYAEGFGKAMAMAIDAFPSGTAYGRGAKSKLRDAFESAIRAAIREVKP